MNTGTEYRKILDVLKRPGYVLLAAVIAVTAFSLYAILLNYSLLFSMLSSGSFSLIASLVPDLILGYPMTTTNFSLFMSAVISLAIGVNFALIAFRLVEQSSFGKQGASSFGGMTVAVLAPACPACATALFAVAGISSVFAVLPFRGTEIKVLALLMLAGSAVWISSQINEEVCEFC